MARCNPSRSKWKNREQKIVFLEDVFKNIQDLDERDDMEMQIELLQYTVSEAEQNIGNFKAEVKLNGSQD